jgi:flagellar export protein FliJ
MTRVELWGFLETRAAEVRDTCAGQWRAAHADSLRLQAHQERLGQLYVEYGQQQRQTQSGSHQVHQTSSLRHTLAQLLVLQERVGRELDAARAHEAQCRQRLDRAEAEVLKARTVAQKAREEALAAENRAQQRRQDAASVQRYWLARLGQGEA